MAAKAILCLIGFYKRRVSPFLPDSCKYYPTCSSYASGAIKAHGAFKGVALAVWRLLRCNPFSKGGYDPVPEKGDISGRMNRLASIKR